MRIDPAGYPFIAAFALPAALLVRRGHRRSALPVTGLALFMTAFFRDPDRTSDTAVDTAADAVLAPADGVVMVAGTPEPGAAPVGQWQQISIFLSPLDVHVNRAPYGGTVTATHYRPGRFLAAYKNVSGTVNERTEIWLRTDDDRQLVFRQIVGVLARRIVLRVDPGERIATGQRIGVMKFGSRMDVFLPQDCTVEVTKGDRVRGGETVIARWGHQPPP